MTVEGVGETESLADALKLLWLSCRDAAVRKSDVLFRGGLEAFVAVAPEFRPVRSLFGLAGGFRFIPFRGTFLLTIPCGELAGARFFFRLGSLLGSARLLRERGRNIVRQRSREQSGSEQGGKHDFVHDGTSL